MIAAGGRDHARRGNLARQQVGKSSANFEGTGMLQQFQLVNQVNTVESEIGPVNFNHRSSPNVGADYFVGAGDAAAVEDRAVGGDVSGHDAMITTMDF